MRKNIAFALCIVAVAALLAVLLSWNRGSGAVARVNIADHAGFTLPLAEDKIYTYDTETGARLPFSLEVSGGRVRFVNSRCPDHICEGFGWLEREHDEAVCLPAGVVLRVETND